jgi:hypothetical protein
LERGQGMLFLEENGYWGVNVEKVKVRGEYKF